MGEAPASTAIIAAANNAALSESAVAYNAAVAFAREQVDSLSDEELLLLSDWAESCDGPAVSGMTDEARRKEVEFNRGRLLQQAGMLDLAVEAYYRAMETRGELDPQQVESGGDLGTGRGKAKSKGSKRRPADPRLSA